MTTRPRTDTNAEAARALDRIARLLEAQSANPFRVRAYRHGAAALRKLERPLTELLDDGGTEALQKVLGIGPSLATLVREYGETGRIRMLDRLRGQHSPEDVLQTLPGLGEALAKRLHAQLGIETLEDLEAAAYDGRLARLPGFGRRRVEMLREELAGRLLRRRGRARANAALAAGPLPPLGLLLTVDEDYRRRAAANLLPTLTPRRFNPDKASWLPVLHTERDGWTFTALFSNTALAHQLGTTRDWVVVYFERDGHEAQCTVVTETRGVLAGRRVVRGRERECRTHYSAQTAQEELPW